jgi:myosin heavy subunit
VPKFERRDLEIDEISACETGANPGAKVFFFKSKEKQEMDVEKIEDAELKKEVEDFIKEQEDKAAELQKQFDELQKSHDELVAESKEEEPIEKKVEKLPEDMQKAWDENQEQIQKAQEAAQAAKNEVAELRKEALHKEVSDIVKDMPRIATSPEDQKQVIDLLMKMDGKDRDAYVETLKKAETVAGEADSLFKEIGSRNAVPQGATADKVDTLAKEYMAKSETPTTIEAARVHVRETNPDLRDEDEEII